MTELTTPREEELDLSIRLFLRHARQDIAELTTKLNNRLLELPIFEQHQYDAEELENAVAACSDWRKRIENIIDEIKEQFGDD